MTTTIQGAIFSPRDIFRINDIDLSIPPSQIAVRKEDLAWSWKTLRTKASTKIPSGHGMVQASVTIYFAPELLLDLHRLVVEFRQSPFCSISNDYLRQTICPHWPLYQEMAFTMSSLSVTPMRGHPGTFICEIDLRWFNYFPYTFNYLFRREWLTEPLKRADKNVQLSIPIYDAASGLDLETIQSVFVSPNDTSSLEEYDIISQKKKGIVAGRTLQDMINCHGGVVFDNFPLPNRMERSQMVSNPAMSNIYVRFINSLQQKALWKGFGIDACADVIGKSDRQTWEWFTLGEPQPSEKFTKVRRLNDFNYLPRGVGEDWLQKILRTTKTLTFTWHNYVSVDIPSKIKLGMKELYGQIINGETKYWEAIRAETQERLKNWSERTDWSQDSSGLTVPGANPSDPNSLNYLVWYPPTIRSSISSPFGMRNHPTDHVKRPHQGIDLSVPVGTLLYATNDGIVHLIQDNDHGGGRSLEIVHKNIDMTSVYCHLSKYYGVDEGSFVLRGQRIGYSGGDPLDPNAGKTTGPHLHFGLRYTSTRQWVDPYPLLVRETGEPSVTFESDPDVAEEPTQTPAEEDTGFDLSKISNDGALGLTPAEKAHIMEQYEELIAQGYVYYEDDQTVVNVWRRTASLTVQSSSIDDYTNETGELLYKEGALVSSINGGLQHIIASIPIIGQEFPTHQHLGSIEPSYLIELAVMDDTSKLTGIGTVAQILEIMRATLQENARSFRIIPDCWTLCTDHFITRLFGTYTEDDILVDAETELNKITKRSMITATQTETKEGNPGLSSMMFEIAETNPYETEFITATHELNSDIEGRRAEVLKALYRLDLKGPALTAATLALGETLSVEDYDRIAVNDEIKGKIETVSGNSQRLVEFSHNNSLPNTPGTAALYYSLGILESGVFATDKMAGSSSPESLAYRFGEIDKTLKQEPLVDPLYQNYKSGGGVNTITKGKTSEENAYQETAVYDATEFYRQYPEFDKASINDLIGYYNLLTSLLKTTRRMMCEEETINALGTARIKERLYWDWANEKQTSEIYGEMYSQFAYYLTGVLSGDTGSSKGKRRLELAAVDSRVINFDIIPEADKAELKDRESLRSIKEPFMNVFWELPGELFLNALALWAFINHAGLYLLNPNTEWKNYEWFTLNKNLKKSTQNEKAQEVVDSYVSILPLWANVPERIANQFPLLGDIVTRGGELDQSFGMYASFDKFLLSSWLIHGSTTWLPSLIKQSDTPGTYYETLFQAATNAFPEGKGIQKIENSLATQDDYMKGIQTILSALPSSHIKYSCETAIEENKLTWLRSLFAKLSDIILSDAKMMSLLGLEDLIDFNAVNSYRGSECYPDLELPAHPYYPKEQYATTPDFYMWNIYEDGPGTLSQEVLALVVEQTEPAIMGPYQHLKDMMGKGIKAFDDRDKRLEVHGAMGMAPLISSTLKASWEGSDTTEIKIGEEYVSLGEMLTAFPDKDTYDYWKAKGDDGLAEIEKLIDNAQQGVDKAKAGDRPLDLSFSEKGRVLTKEEDAAKTQKKELENIQSLLKSTQLDLRPVMPLLSMFDGNPIYTWIPKADLETYKQLQEKMVKEELFFGSRAAYLGEYLTKETAKSTHESTMDTRVAAMDSYRHAFDPASLIHLARDSAVDILSEKVTMRRAYPTLKLMFVEEDEFESRWLNFDDFHSYNAIKEFTVVESRDMAASTAVITLQNVSGTLDGTKRNVITDLDYFKEADLQQIENDSKYTMMDSRRDSAPRIDSAQDQPFGAVVLRPGLNVQLRCGFANDPALLEVLISGRVVDVTWNTAGDMAEIVVQSFGTELVQTLKGIHDLYEGSEPAGEKEIYRSTHQLLGSMMLSPELRHFGRWEFGQYYQYGESQDSRLDFFDYTQNSFYNRFKVLTGVSSWIVRNPGLTAIAAIGLAALATFTPAGKGVGALGKILRGFGRFGRWIGLGGEAAEVAAVAATSRRAVGLATAAALTKKPVLVVALNQARKVQRIKRVLHPTRFTDLSVGRQITSTGLGGGGYLTIAPQGSQISNALLKRQIAKIEAEAISERSLYLAHLSGFPGGFAPLRTGIWAGGFKPAVYNSAKWGMGRYWNLGVVAPLRLTSAALVAGGMIDLSRFILFTPMYNKTIGDLKKFYARNQVTLMLSPQDDNLYPPSPKDYMRLKHPGFKEAVGRLGWSSGNAMFTVATGMDGDHSTLEEWWKAWHRTDWVLEKRVEPEQCIYRPERVTIWDIFHEMSLRHPGWIYSARPYGTKFQYTMFFGVPSQRYWSKPAGNDFVFRMNMLRDMLDHGDITKEQYKRLYGERALDSLLKITDDSTQFLTDIVGADYPGAAEADMKTSDTIATVKMTYQVMDEYLKGLEARFVPFRRYHMLTSEQDIIANNIMSSEHNVANAVSAVYRDIKDSTLAAASVTVKANSMIPEHNIVCETISFPNCKGYTMGLRYAMGQLIYELKQMYRGELLVLGNPRIRPWDICLIMDSYTDIFGPVEVEQVVHQFSHETGFITEIKPNAVVFANEISSWPIIEALKLYMMAKNDIEDGKKDTDPDTLINEVWGESVSQEMRDDIMYKYASLALGDLTIEDLLPAENEDDISLRDGSGQMAAIGDTAGTSAALVASSLVAGITGVSAGALAGLKLGSGAAAAIGATIGGIAGLATAAGSSQVKDFTVKRLAEPLGMTWLIAGPILFNKCLQDDVVAVVPLLKNGQPIVSGLTYRDPLAFWTSFRGKVSNLIDDTYSGTRDQLIDWNLYGNEWWRRYKNENKPAMLGY